MGSAVCASSLHAPPLAHHRLLTYRLTCRLLTYRLQVYDAFRAAANWAQLLPPDQTFSVESRVWSCSNLTSSQVGVVGRRRVL